MNDLERRISSTLRGHEGDAPAFEPSDARGIVGRTRRRQIANTAGAVIGALVIVVGLAAGIGGLVRADQTVTPVGTPPPSRFDAETTTFLESFLQARIDGEGAESYVEISQGWSMVEGVPLLYATTTGSPYERFEFEPDGHDQLNGDQEVKVRLFADGDETVVEQLFSVTNEAGHLGLVYLPTISDAAPTTENGEPVAVPYAWFDGEVTARAAHPWAEHFTLDPGLVLSQNPEERLQLAGDPVAIGTGCEPSGPPADADRLARSIRSDPDFDATAPGAVSVGGVRALQMDVIATPGASVCELYPAPMVLKPDDNGSWRGLALEEGSRMRLYLLDLPGGSPRVLAIAIVAPQDRFEQVVAAAAPVMDSLEFATQ